MFYIMVSGNKSISLINFGNEEVDNSFFYVSFPY